MRIVFFAKGDRRLPSSRTRAYLVSDYLKILGYESETYQVKTRSWWNLSFTRVQEFVRNVRILWSLEKEDLVFLQRTVHQVDFLFLILVRKVLFGLGYAFDFDDAIFLEKGHADFKTSLIIRHADVVFVGSQFLKEYAERFNKNVYLFTTLLDTDNIFVPRTNRSASNEIIIGWTGTPMHYDNMELLVPALIRLAAERFPIRLFLLGGGPNIPQLFEDIPGLALTSLPFLPTDNLWSEPRKIATYIQQFDIGVYPLQKTEWNRGKDLHKAKEYMACGVASVVSNWGENPLLIKNGVEGLLVDDDEWYDALKKLVVDTAYRAELAERGHEWVVRKCSFRAHVPRMLELMKHHAH